LCKYLLEMEKKIIEIFKENNGILYSKQLNKSSGLRYQLNALLKNNEIIKLKQGLYILNHIQNQDERILLSRMIPNGVFCLFSAWDFYELTTTVSYQYHISINRNNKTKLPDYPPVKFYYWSEKYYYLGITEAKINEQKIKIYNLERSVCDVVKFRNKVGQEMVNEILKAYIQRKDRNLDLLMKYAREMKIENILNPYIQTLI
jgi:predicted transcriptional regulator of viral defense system